MRRLELSMIGFVLFGATAVVRADPDRPDLNGTWKLNQSADNSAQESKEFVLTINETGQHIHITETRGPRPKEDVSDFACATTGQECGIEDGGEKAKAFVYYNGPVLVILKTHGRKGDTVDKQRLTLSPDGNSLVLEIEHIDPAGKDEKLVLSKGK